MKRFIMSILFIAALSILGILWINSDVLGQDLTVQPPLQEQLREMKIEIPFVDRDGDGINDLLQNGWGLRFLQRYQNRRAVWEQMMKDDEKGGMLIDTDGDGVPDTPMRDIFRNRMNERLDTDGDGVPDTPWAEHMRRRFQLFDQNGDGIPDELTPEQIRQHFQEMQQWREQIRDNLRNGLPAFTDADGDGIPDNLPGGFGWMRRHKKGRF